MKKRVIKIRCCPDCKVIIRVVFGQDVCHCTGPTGGPKWPNV
jgi:uncharacterized protein YbaR (Trm112 family)